MVVGAGVEAVEEEGEVGEDTVWAVERGTRGERCTFYLKRMIPCVFGAENGVSAYVLLSDTKVCVGVGVTLAFLSMGARCVSATIPCLFTPHPPGTELNCLSVCHELFYLRPKDTVLTFAAHRFSHSYNLPLNHFSVTESTSPAFGIKLEV